MQLCTHNILRDNVTFVMRWKMSQNYLFYLQKCHYADLIKMMYSV